MDKEGLVELDAVEKTGNRSKAIYSVTPAGKDEFYTLMLQSFQQSSVVFPTELYTALTFSIQILFLLNTFHPPYKIKKENYRNVREYESWTIY